MNEFLAKVLRNAGKVFYSNLKDNVAVLRRENTHELDQALAAGLKAEKLNSGLVERLRGTLGAELAEDFLGRLPASEGYVIFDRGELCGWIWGSAHLRPREGVPPLLYPVQPPAGAYYLYDLFIYPPHRKLKIANALMRHIMQEAWNSGAEQILLTFHDKNKAMEKITGRFGFEVVGALTYRRILCFVRKDISDLDKICKPGLSSKAGTGTSPLRSA